MTMTEEQRRDHIAALTRELEACERQGLTDRVAAIRAQLDYYATVGATKAKRAAKR